MMILGGLGYFAAIILQLAGTARLSGSLSSLMNSLNPVAISVMAAIFLKERITWKNAIGIVISLAGVYVILGTGELQADIMGILFSAGSVILWSAASVSIRRISEYYDPVQTALYGMAIALILNVPAAVFENMFIFRSHPTEKAGLPVCCSSWNCSSTHLLE
ncbi:DMT family transporter [Enterocloster sp.]|uniref:DMT family transporter n=1 Tax=Enterocloster sp. TaxID=2719315 RepID=UPI003AB78170